MTSRAPAPPPRIPGFTFVKMLGQGGYADVYLYQQDAPKRVVAVKVLIAELAGTEAAARLRREANAMAGLSQHQNIVTVFQSGTAADGRAYMVMEYYPRPALSQGLKTGQRSLASVLSIGIQLAGAVESAHRLGILHRDIKPANILVDRAGRPVLGDFGIAMTNAEAAAGGAQGMSIPYSPPESFDADPHPLPQSDVWSLAATVYALLTGRAPFEEPGGDNRPHAMIERIKHAAYRPVGRSDVPASLDQVLATAMAKAPASRYASMQAFGWALGEIEQELHLNNTPMDIIDTSLDDATGASGQEVAGTQLRPITMIDPSGASTGHTPTVSVTMPAVSPGGSATTAVPSPAVAAPGAHDGQTIAPATVRAPGLDQSVNHTHIRQRPTVPGTAIGPEGEPPGSPLRWVIVAGVVVLVVAVVGVVAWRSGGQPSTDDPTTSPSATAQDPIGVMAPSAPVDLTCQLAADKQTASCSWTNPEPRPGDYYRWTVVGDPAAKSTPVQSTSITGVPVTAGQGSVCVSVRVIRNGQGSTATTACA